MAEKDSNFSGLRVVSFESRKAFEMQSLIERNGGVPILAPSLREIPFEINREAMEFAKKLIHESVDIVILMTGIGTRFLVQVIEKEFSKEEFLKALSKTMTVARGPKPVAALKEVGVSPSIVVPPPNTWREILASLDDAGAIKEKKVFVQEYGIQNREFIKELKKRGAHVIRVPVYRWSLPEDLNPLRKAILDVCDSRADILLFTNATQIHHVLQVAAEDGLESSFREAMERVVVASVGPIVSENLKDLGLPVDFEAKEAKMGLFVKEASIQCPALLQGKQEKWRRKSSSIQIRKYEIKPYDPEESRESAFLKACRLEKTSYTPIWLMRQAGRFMKDYRELRAKVSFLELCKNSDLACEVTVTAQEKLGVDAAIIFSDILLMIEPMGIGLEYTKGEGPYIHRPVRSQEDVENLKSVNCKESLSFMFDAIRKTRTALKPSVPLIGFAGAPFTMVSYMVEGKSSENYLHTKTMMNRQPQTFYELMNKVTLNSIEYVKGQIEAGAQAVQIFDSWIGCLSPEDYRAHIFFHMKNFFSALPKGFPVIHFGTGASSLLDLMRDAGGTVIGLDWRVDLDTTWNRLGTDVAIQGNLDPTALLSDISTIRKKVKKILAQAQGRPGHIFNLGHGVLPQTPEENVKALVEIVHELST